MKYFIANIIVKTLDALFKRDLQGIPVIFYHAIGNNKSTLFVQTEEFEKQMEFLAKNGWHSILPQDIENNFGRKKVFLITFDDGYKSVYDIALPILKKYGFNATVFVSAGNIGEKSIWARTDEDKNYALLTSEHIQELKKAGWCVGNHFANHKNLTELSDEEVAKEYQISCEVFEKINTPENKNIVAYPFNRYNLNVIEILREAGVRMAFAGGNRLCLVSDDLLAMPRIQIDNNFSRFKLYFSNSFNRIKNILP